MSTFSLKKQLKKIKKNKNALSEDVTQDKHHGKHTYIILTPLNSTFI